MNGRFTRIIWLMITLSFVAAMVYLSYQLLPHRVADSASGFPWRGPKAAPLLLFVVATPALFLAVRLLAPSLRPQLLPMYISWVLPFAIIYFWWLILFENFLLNAWGGWVVLLTNGPMLAMLLYLLRCRKRGLYGAVEIAFGLLNYASVFFDLAKATPGPDLVAKLPAVTWFKMIAGIYIIVRGLDNVGQASAPEKYPAWWRWAFQPGRKTGSVTT